MFSLQYRPSIDGLRAIAVLSVFVFHLNPSWLPGGFVGVDVFFVISGFLITSIILKDCESGEFSLLRFYQRRVARIFPAFFVVALATLLGASLIYSPQDLASAGANLAAAVLSVANMKFMLQGDYFQISPDAQPFLHYWSLSVEEQFYLFFPLLFLGLFRFARRQLVLLLGVLTVGSFVACVILTSIKPVWAFYLLPTRAWELSAGCLLAVISASSGPVNERFRGIGIPLSGLLLIVLSVLLLHESPHFPGWQALLPVLGAVCVILPGNARNPVERWLSTPLLVQIGRMSYSLYLWHWPVFSLVDYRFYLFPEPIRLGLKMGLSVLLAAASFAIIENPARAFLNQRKIRPIVFASLAATLAICVTIGIFVRRANYVNADLADVTKGGLSFLVNEQASSVVLMGDSNGSMYGKVLKEVCAELGVNLTVISVAAGDPLPPAGDTRSRLWEDSLAVIRRTKPDYLVMACQWTGKLDGKSSRLDAAIEELQPLVGHLILLNQPSALPRHASREAIRNGVRPPFYEPESARTSRRMTNSLLNAFRSPKVSVIDIAKEFESPDGVVYYLDDQGRQLYHDAGHLSGHGAERIRELLRNAISGA